MVGNLAQITACARTPDQLLSYVSAVSGLKSIPCGPYVLHHGDGYGVLVAYSPDASNIEDDVLEKTLADLLAKSELRHITVIASRSPANAPEWANIKKDNYWFLDLPVKNPRQKLRNMLKRAKMTVEICQSGGKNSWTNDHARLVSILCERKKAGIDEGTEYIFGQLANYLEKAPDARLFSAYEKNALVGCALGDFSALGTAFYMFAFRSPLAPPGTADALLEAIINEATERGHGRINLGLGIDPGVEFFKQKWGARPALPCIETSWETRKKKTGWLGKLFGR